MNYDKHRIKRSIMCTHRWIKGCCTHALSNKQSANWNERTRTSLFSLQLKLELAVIAGVVHPGLLTAFKLLLSHLQRKSPPREEEGRGGAIASLECQLVEREKKYFAFIWPVVVMLMISLGDV